MPRDDRSRYWSGARRAQATQAAQHRGRGPRGYQRSDQRIYEDLCERLMEDERIDPSAVEVKVTDGEVTLTGTIRSRNAKRRATDVAEGISGVKQVYNNIRVSDEQHAVGRRTYHPAV
jgi:osmotically-inducible protein OsmY